MPSLTEAISYSKPSKSMEVSLGLLASLFNAKLDGGVDTDYGKKFDIEPTIPIDTGIQEVMNMIQTNTDFRILLDLGGPFMEKWGELEGTLQHWDAQETQPDKNWIFELITAYYDDMKLIRGR